MEDYITIHMPDPEGVRHLLFYSCAIWCNMGAHLLRECMMWQDPSMQWLPTRYSLACVLVIALYGTIIVCMSLIEGCSISGVEERSALSLPWCHRSTDPEAPADLWSAFWEETSGLSSPDAWRNDDQVSSVHHFETEKGYGQLGNCLIKTSE